VGFGPRSFSAAGPSSWNSLLLELKMSLTVGQFSSRLKTEISYVVITYQRSRHSSSSIIRNINTVTD